MQRGLITVRNFANALILLFGSLIPHVLLGGSRLSATFKFIPYKKVCYEKRVIVIFAAVITVVAIPTAANAHVGVQLRGNTLVAGQSSRIYLSLGHGCTYKNTQYGTRIFSAVIPSTAGKPTPEFHQGFKATVVASTEVDAKNNPLSYTVTWTAKSANYTIDPYTFYDFGLKVKWDASPQKIFFPTTQTCYAPTSTSGVKKPLYLRWIQTDGTTPAATEDTEFGPAPAVTTVAG